MQTGNCSDVPHLPTRVGPEGTYLQKPVTGVTHPTEMSFSANHFELIGDW
jgi:hypothetical protein